MAKNLYTLTASSNLCPTLFVAFKPEVGLDDSLRSWVIRYFFVAGIYIKYRNQFNNSII